MGAPVGRALASVLTLALVGCASTASHASPGSPSSSSPSSATSPVSSAAVSPSSSRATSPAPSASLDPSTARWTRLGEGQPPAGVDTFDSAVVAFDGGFVTLGMAAGGEPFAISSPNGLAWQATSLAEWLPGCPGWLPAGVATFPDTTMGIATNGRDLVIVGSERPRDSTGCPALSEDLRPIAWVSNDGRRWRRSATFPGSAKIASQVGWTEDGWLAQGGTSATGPLWRSTDGITWQSVGSEADPGDYVSDVAIGADGTVVASWEDPERNANLVSGRARFSLYAIRGTGAWQRLPADRCTQEVYRLAAPASSGLQRWVVARDDWPADTVTVCTSADLGHWSAASLDVSVTPPKGLTVGNVGVSQLLQSRWGAVAIVEICFNSGVPCATAETRAYLGIGGATWSRLPDPPVAARFVTTVAGDLYAVSDEGRAWSLWRLDGQDPTR